MVRVAIDAMGGDNAPAQIVKGAVKALLKTEKTELEIIFTGDSQKIEQNLSELSNEAQTKGFDRERISIIHTDEVIETGENPVKAVMTKKNSSLVTAMKLVKEGKADALVSSGSTGAILVGSGHFVGKLKGVKRTPLAPVIPTLKGGSLLIDCGANVDAKPEYLVQFSHMGSIYMEYVCRKKNPSVALLNIGAEEEKGNSLVKETFAILKNEPGINFIGSVEPAEMIEGKADVIVCDAFSGNIALKTYEATGKVLLGTLKKTLSANLKNKLGAALVYSSLKKELIKFDSSQYGGAPMLGLNGLVVKTHGSAKAGEICNAIMQCLDFVNEDIPAKISRAFISD